MDKYLDIDTVKTSTKVYKNTLPYDKILTKADAYTSDDQVEKWAREFNSHYRACIGSLIYVLYTRVYLKFSVHKVLKFSS